MSCWEVALCRSPSHALGGCFGFPSTGTTRAPACVPTARQQPAVSIMAPSVTLEQRRDKPSAMECVPSLAQTRRGGTDCSMAGDQSWGAGTRTPRSGRSWWGRRVSCTWAWASLVVRKAPAMVRGSGLRSQGSGTRVGSWTWGFGLAWHGVAWLQLTGPMPHTAAGRAVRAPACGCRPRHAQHKRRGGAGAVTGRF